MVITADELVEPVAKDSVIYIEHFSDEGQELVLETEAAGTITIADELVVDEKQSEDGHLQQAQTQNLGLLPETD